MFYGNISNYINRFIKNFYGKYIRRFLISKFFFFNKFNLLRIVGCDVYVTFKSGSNDRILGALRILEVITGYRGCINKKMGISKSKKTDHFSMVSTNNSCFVSLNGKQVYYIVEFLNKTFLPFILKRKLTLLKSIDVFSGSFELRIKDVTYFYKYCDNIYEEDFEIVFYFRFKECLKLFKFFKYNRQQMLTFFFPSFFNFKNV